MTSNRYGSFFRDSPVRPYNRAAMSPSLDRLVRVVERVYPARVRQAQAVAFNMFVAFFPSLLFALGLLSISGDLPHAGHALLVTVRLVFPTGTSRFLSNFLDSRGVAPWKMMALSFGAMLLAGSQVMVALSEGVRMIDGLPEPPGFVRRQVRAFSLLLITMAPWFTVVVLTVFAAPTSRLAHQTVRLDRFPARCRGPGIFRRGDGARIRRSAAFLPPQPAAPARLGSLIPGAVLATVLWWVVDVCLGLYFLHVPYRVVYGRMAAAIGLLIWMYSTALVIFLGAAYNAEILAERKPRPIADMPG